MLKNAKLYGNIIVYRYLRGECYMKKRLVAMITAFALVVTALFCFNVSIAFGANSGTCGATGADVRWSYDTKTTTLTITGTGAMKNYVAASLIPWKGIKAECTKVVIGEGVTEISRVAFYEFAAMTSIDLPSTLTKINGGILDIERTGGYGAFNGCTALESIILPEGLVEIDGAAFNGCTALKSITIPDSVTNLGEYAFRNCTNLTTVKYGTGLTATGISAFYNAGIKNIILSPTITEISGYSFFGCPIVEFEIPERITRVGIRAFANCSFLTSVTVLNKDMAYEGLTIAEENPFYNGTDSKRILTFYGHKGSTTEDFVVTHPNSNYLFVSIDACDHISTHEVIDPAPTCTETGLSSIICDSCNQTLKTNTIAATGHKWFISEQHDETEANGHIFNHYECKNGCGETKEEVEHVEYVEGFYTYVNNAKCDGRLKVGYETYTCTMEGCTERPKVNVIPVRHTVAEFKVTQEPTCTENGIQEGVCSVCNNTVTEDIAALGHQYEQIDELDNTLEDGHTYQSFKCTVCGDETLNATHVEWIDGYYNSTEYSIPTCTIAGRRLDTCTVEGCSQTRLVRLEPAEHELEEIGTRQEPTCTSRGTVFYGCKNCNYTTQESIPALGHDNELKEHVDPTCTTAGYDRLVCKVCGYATTESISALGHIPDETVYDILKEQNCEEDGLAISVCKRELSEGNVCGEEFQIILEKFGHSYVEVESPSDHPGHTSITPVCERCNYRDVSKPPRHDEWIEGHYKTTVVTQNCANIPMLTTDTCDDCGTTRTNTYSDVPSHYYEFTGLNDNGRLSYTCSVCKNVYTTSVAATYALWNIRYVNTAPADTSLGYLFELNNDGVINAKDYAILSKFYKNRVAVEKLNK